MHPFDINKAVVVLATAISQGEGKNQFTVNNSDLTLLSKFFYSSNDYEAKFFVIGMLNKNRAKEFLPIAAFLTDDCVSLFRAEILFF